MEKLDFHPFYGLASKHLQTISAALLYPGRAPPSSSFRVRLQDGDELSCEVSTPQQAKKTVLLVHGLGGSHASSYMIRIARLLYNKGHQVVRVNLRGAGSGRGLTNRPYNAGTSDDLFEVIQALSLPPSSVFVAGFSLGGNVVLKLAGELGERAKQHVERFIAICPPVDLLQSIRLLEQNPFYHHHYLKTIGRQGALWIKNKVRSLYEFDDLITAPLWGYKSAEDYYRRCSSIHFLPKISQTTHILFAEDDPFVPLSRSNQVTLTPNVRVFCTKQGGHMGFLSKSKPFYWLDHTLSEWIE